MRNLLGLRLILPVIGGRGGCRKKVAVRIENKLAAFPRGCWRTLLGEIGGGIGPLVAVA